MKKNILNNLELQDKLYVLEKRANRMRENPTFYEKKMSEILDSFKVDYIQQYVFGFYIADFYFPKQNKVIEVNGSSHIGKEKYDAKRMNYFIKNGIQILNIRNENVFRSTQKVSNFLFGKKKKQKKDCKEKEKSISESKLIRVKKYMDAPPLKIVFKRKREGYYKSEKDFKNAYQAAVKRHIRFGIPFLGSDKV